MLVWRSETLLELASELEAETAAAAWERKQPRSLERQTPVETADQESTVPMREGMTRTPPCSELCVYVGD